MAENLQSTLVKIDVDRSLFTAGLDQVVAEAKEKGETAGKEFRKAFERAVQVKTGAGVAPTTTLPGGGPVVNELGLRDKTPALARSAAEATKQTGDEAAKAAPKVREFHTSMQVAARTGKGLTQSLVREVSPGLAEMTGRFSEVIMATRNFGAVFSVGAASVAVLGVAIAQALQVVEKFRQAQVALNTAAKLMDVGALKGVLLQQFQAVENLKSLQETASQSGRGLPFEKFIARIKLALSPTEGIEALATNARTAIQKLYYQFERPINLANLDAARAKVKEAALAFQASEPQDVEEVNSLLSQRKALLSQIFTSEDTIRKTESQRAAAEANLLGLVDQAADLERKYSEERKDSLAGLNIQFATLDRAARDSAQSFAALAQSRRSLANDIRNAEVEANKSTVENTKAERVLWARSTSERLQIERDALAETMVINAERLEGQKQFLQSELAEIMSSSTLSAQAREAAEIDLTGKLNLLAIERTRIDATNKSLMQQNATQLRQAEWAEDDSLFQHRLALGQTTVKEEIDRNREILSDSRRTVAERIKAEETVFNAQQKIRDKARQAAGPQGIIGEAIANLRAKGQTAGSTEEIEAEARRLQGLRQDLVAQTRETLGAGGRVALDQIQSALEAVPKLEEIAAVFKEFASFSGVFRKAFEGTPEVESGIRRLQDTYREILQTLNGPDQMAAMKSQWKDAWESNVNTVKVAFGTIEEAISAGNTMIARSIAQQVQAALANVLDRDGRRF